MRPRQVFTISRGGGTGGAGNIQPQAEPVDTAKVFRFDLAAGAVLARFNTGTPADTVVGARVKK